jgi:hypothetical protein
MKKLTLLVTALTSIVLVGTAFGQTAKDAIEAMQKLGARTEVGISYKDYGPALGEANYKVKTYLENPESDKNPKLKGSIKKSWLCYLAVNQVWEYQFARGQSSTPNLLDRQSYLKTDAPFIDLLIKYHPEISQKIQDGRFLAFSDAIAVIWKEASQEVQFASKLLSIQDSSKK